MIVKIYSTPSCPWCIRAKEFFKSNSISFEDIDVSSDINGAREMVKKSGQMGVPVIDINGEIIIGFDESRIREIITENE